MTQHKWCLTLCLFSEEAGGAKTFLPQYTQVLSVISASKPQYATHQFQRQLGTVLRSLFLGEPFNEMEIMPQIFSCAFSLLVVPGCCSSSLQIQKLFKKISYFFPHSSWRCLKIRERGSRPDFSMDDLNQMIEAVCVFSPGGLSSRSSRAMTYRRVCVFQKVGLLQRQCYCTVSQGQIEADCQPKTLIKTKVLRSFLNVRLSKREMTQINNIRIVNSQNFFINNVLFIYNISSVSLNSMFLLSFYFLGTWSDIFYCPVLPDEEEINCGCVEASSVKPL